MHRALITVAMALSLCAAFIDAAAAQSGRVVNVYNWSD
jgi:spermidine/putrescine-binding protein